MYLVGLTGGIASGKSTVAERMVKHGAELLDADVIAREVVLPDTPAYRKIVEHFGAGILDADGFIDRAALGAIVFSDPAKLRLLNELTHPRIFAAIAERLEVLQPFDGIVVLDVPLLVEAGAARSYDTVVVVAADPEVQVRRLIEERGLTEDEARGRLAAQAPLAERVAVADHVVWNNGSLGVLQTEVDQLMRILDAAARRKVAELERGIPDH